MTELFQTDPIVPPDPPGLTVLHDREYRVRAYRLADDRLLIRGAVRDQKPPGIYMRHDPDPLTIHHMQVDLTIGYPSVEILDVDVAFEMHPRDDCPTIAGHYHHLVGLSIARGFTHRVRELFGGPRGCTHTTALLQAMAPVAMQCFYSMRSVLAQERGETDPMTDPRRHERDQTWRRNIGTCHVWAPEGAAVAAREAGTPEPVAVFLRERVARLGLRPSAPEAPAP